MKLTVDARALKAALARLSGVISSRHHIPVLAMVHIEAGDGLRLRGSDADTHALSDCPAAVAVRGAVCAPYAEIAKLAAAAGSAEIEIEASGNVLRLTWGWSSASLLTIDPEDFPKAWGNPALLQPVDGDLFAAALNYCAPAMSTEEARYYLRGAHIEPHEGGTRFAATDGHRLHIATTPMNAFGGPVILGTREVALAAAVAGGGGPFRLYLSAEKWGCASDGIEVWGKTVDGSFPDIVRVIPRDPEFIATVDSADLVAAIGTAAIGTDGGAEKRASVTIRAAGDRIGIQGSGGGALAQGVSTEIPADVQHECVIKLAARYAVDALRAMPGDFVSIHDGGSIALLEPAEQRAEMRCSAVIMGMRTAEAVRAA